MYLYKEGLEYYIFLIDKFTSKIETETKNHQNVPIYNFTTVDEISVIEKLDKLKSHIVDINKHVSTEDNVLKKLIVEITKIGDITFFSESSKDISSIVAGMDRLCKLFIEVDTNISRILEQCKDTNNHISKQFTENSYELKQRLIDIKKTSEYTASSIKQVVGKISNAKHLITTEEEALTDFNKNMMSWLN